MFISTSPLICMSVFCFVLFIVKNRNAFFWKSDWLKDTMIYTSVFKRDFSLLPLKIYRCHDTENVSSLLTNMWIILKVYLMIFFSIKIKTTAHVWVMTANTTKKSFMAERVWTYAAQWQKHWRISIRIDWRHCTGRRRCLQWSHRVTSACLLTPVCWAAVWQLWGEKKRQNTEAVGMI